VGQAASIVGNQLINGVSLSSPTSRLKTTIALYMPDGIHSNYSQEYSEFELTSELGKGLNTIRTVDHVLQTANKQSSTSDTMAKALSSDAAVIKAAVDIASGVVGVGPNLGSAILQGRGYAVNPAVQMIYRGATLRSFSLTFIFTPKSQQEAKMVNNIIHTFKYHSLPKLENASQSVVNNLFLVPPSLFEIDFHNGDNSNEYLPRYDKCVLTGMEIDDTPNGWTTHPDGSPVQRTMTLNFRELSILHKDKISENVEKSVYR
jgi:hypothetical protein